MKQLAMYINGRFENDFNGEWRDVLNPSTEEAIAREPKGGKADVDRAVAAARAAQPAWERLPAVERGAYLRKIAQGIRERADELTDTIVAEGGKTKDLARIEVMFTADYLDYQAEWARRYEGEIIQSACVRRMGTSGQAAAHWRSSGSTAAVSPTDTACTHSGRTWPV